MVTDWYAERYRLGQLRQQHPAWSKVRLAEEMGRSYGCKKWSKRLAEAKPDDETVWQGQARTPKLSREPIAPLVVKEILTIRDEPPEGLQRVPGPETIKYYLHQNEELKGEGYYLPSSSSTIWRILDENGRIVRTSRPEYTPLTRNQPMAVWEMDFKDVTSDKRMHLVETLNIVDTGTSILVDNPARADYNAETVMESLVDTWQQGDIDGRIEGGQRVVFSFEGMDEMDPVSGAGTMTLQDGRLIFKLMYHDSDDYTYECERR